MDKTKIEWCDSTWNPVTGCLHGCEYCYARKIANRFGHEVLDRSEESQNGLHCLYSRVERNPYPYLFEPTLHAYRLDEPQKWEKPRTIFVCSMADLFGEWVPDKWIETVFEACGKASQHRYLFLTKNPQRYLKLVKQGKLSLLNTNPNMWFGTSLTQITDIKRVLDTFQFINCGINTFISIEPLLGDISPYEDWDDLIMHVDWVIIGAETGNRKDKVIPQKAWIDSIVKDCTYNDIPVFMKDSLIPIVGEENMRREFPWDKQ